MLTRFNGLFDTIYADSGRDSIAPGDAFEVALLDPSAGEPLLGGIGLTRSDNTRASWQPAHPSICGAGQPQISIDRPDFRKLLRLDTDRTPMHPGPVLQLLQMLVEPIYRRGLLHDRKCQQQYCHVIMVIKL